MSDLYEALGRNWAVPDGHGLPEEVTSERALPSPSGNGVSSDPMPPGESVAIALADTFKPSHEVADSFPPVGGQTGHGGVPRADTSRASAGGLDTAAAPGEVVRPASPGSTDANGRPPLQLRSELPERSPGRDEPARPMQRAGVDQLGWYPSLGRVEASDDDLAFELRRSIGVLVKRRWEVLFVVCLIVVPVAIATYFQERLYRSSAMVQIDPEPLQVSPYPDFTQTANRPHYETFMKTQEQVLRGPTLRARVAERLRSDPDVTDVRDQAGRLGGLAVQRVENTQIYRLGFTATHPEAAARVANIFAEEYIKLNFENRQTTRLKAQELLQRELESLKERVQLSEKELVLYAQRNSIPTEDPGRGLIRQKLNTLAGQVSEADADLFIARSRLEALQKASVQDFPDGLTTGVISNIMTKLVSLEHDLTGLRSSFGENWPAVVQKRREIALAHEQLEREKVAALNQAREQAILESRSAERKRDMLASSLGEQKKLGNQLETALIQFNTIRREVETNQKMYEGLLDRLKQTSVATGMEFGGFQIVEPAGPSYTPASPRTAWNLGLASLLGLGLGICVAFARDFWKGSVTTLEELEQLAVLPVLGAIPRLSVAANREKSLSRIQTVGETGVRQAGRLLGMPRVRADVPPTPPQDQFASDPAAAEAVRHVCASILLSRSGRPPKKIMVTSAVSGEGKSTLAREIGLAFCETGARTLLVECDLRRPSLGSSFGIDSSGGLSLYLSGHGSFPLIHSTSHSNLYVVTAGPIPPNPPALLNSERFQQFLAQVTASFQFVILDTPPVLPVADARVLAPLVEGVVLVVRAGLLSKQTIRRAGALLHGAGTPLLGVVLNDAETHGSDLQYSYYAGYHAG